MSRVTPGRSGQTLHAELALVNFEAFRLFCCEDSQGLSLLRSPLPFGPKRQTPAVGLVSGTNAGVYLCGPVAGRIVEVRVRIEATLPVILHIEALLIEGEAPA